MSLANPNRAILNDAKRLAAQQQFDAALAQLDKLPSSPDVDRLRNRIEKARFVQTGQPVGSEPMVNDAPVIKAKRRNDPIKEAIHAGLHVLAILIVIWGIFRLVYAANVEDRYYTYDASAIQMTQVYTEGMFVLLQALALFALAGLIELFIIARKD